MIASNIVLTDDDAGITGIYGKILEKEGYTVHTANDGEEGLNLIETYDCDLIITDMYMPKMGGLEFISRIRQINKEIPIIVITGEGSIENAVKAVKLGAFSYIQKPLDVEQFVIEVKKATSIATIDKQNRYMKETLTIAADSFIGDSPGIKIIKDKINIISKIDSNVLILGESGTGKELVAQSIHDNSSRKDNLIVKVNCAALSPTLLESELFGHEKGSFTGAIARKIGKFEIANGGTLFLDEIGEMNMDMQAKLLRVLQYKTFERVGGNIQISSNFRLIAATNKNLEEEISKGKFREDLYYRLNVIPLRIPPLRERKTDIKLLIDYFSKKFAAEFCKEPIVISDEIINKFLDYEWPGNIRELRNAIERLSVYSLNGEIIYDELPSRISKKEDLKINLNNNLSEAKGIFEKDYIRKSLEMNNWNVSKTAELLSLTRKSLYEKINKYHLKSNE
ncbi:two-component system, NtrC family, response regulator AtoC [Dethiosulfatibacter aminovorans DSM 17477]|uniref:Two-component system, NtrC family, response regulator AtoC n=1 Tax=Dethiosulfatibacter aminovorans DSM 17477 TaxID=1121476 RepID=A0A1M6AT91_9FIRM|nr:sigma-54 dependent transcriptional regulator [Dethiosulfatibacter aminovorans]SHI39680.1 two-component system, NtrC family, response regulator AtoC [Dethiosulfatibacter aminovorans DSM 17477]